MPRAKDMHENAYTCASLPKNQTFPASNKRNEKSRREAIKEAASFSAIELIDDGLGNVSISNESSSVPTLESLTTGASSPDKRKSKTQPKPTSHVQLPRLPDKSQGPLQIRNENNRFLSWRSDPNASFSDWTIEVATVEGNEITCSSFYHCHSNVLVWGPRQSDVFVKLFQERMQQMPNSSITQIELTPPEAEVFPSLLDFMYCETTLSLSADRICNIYVLAEKFESNMLMTAIQTFVEKSLTFEQSVEFLSFARQQRQRDKIEKLVLFTNSKICGYLVQHPKESKKVPPEMLAHILHRRAQVMKVLKGEDPRKFSGEWEIERSRLLSAVVAECCYHAVVQDTKKPLLTRHTFDRLINPKHLPALDSRAALKLLQVDAVLDSGKDLERRGSNHHGNALSSVESRCIQALVGDWRNILKENLGSIFTEALSSVKGSVLAEILILVSNEYERQIGTSSTPRGHDILQNLHLNNSRSGNNIFEEEAAGIYEVVAKEDNSTSTPKSLPYWETDTGSSNTRVDDSEDSDDGSASYPANRYSVASEHRLVFK